MSNGTKEDLELTRKEVLMPKNDKNKPNWLRHKKQAQQIDEMILKACYTYEDIEHKLKISNPNDYRKVNSIKGHVKHLEDREDDQKPHNLKIKENQDGILEFVFSKGKTQEESQKRVNTNNLKEKCQNIISDLINQGKKEITYEMVVKILKNENLSEKDIKEQLRRL